MPDSLKHRIIVFISKLTPLYTFERVGNVVCARSLVDGTLILPNGNPDSDEPQENQDDLHEYDLNDDDRVTVYWQGDKSRKSVVSGIHLVSMAVARYVEIRAIPEAKETKAEYAHLAHHFTVKTGDGLLMPAADDDDQDLYSTIADSLKTLSKDALISLIKKQVGL